MFYNSNLVYLYLLLYNIIHYYLDNKLNFDILK